ncbi:uncharacterized protein TM35_000361670 [Trypanosoma theileri]|uniref:Uncharacterized protein n=1 Tax=Trypanosoma theileri TaxID=67003 RepID=A0A1X0NKZ5_9TRYP|nr:uncharacterized protein TM35_000361670 [Trypanosoma theileri]ORC85307.1 hypothetical protein TM35_000361670 [Trypanosoma theileri]
MGKKQRTRFSAILLFFFLLVLLLWTGCPAVAQTTEKAKMYTYAILNLPYNPTESMAVTASKRCAQNGMHLAMPNKLAKAVVMEKLISQYGLQSTRILFGGYALACPTYTSLYFLVPSFNFSVYPVKGSVEECNALLGVGEGVEKVCSLNNTSLGTPIYRFDNNKTVKDCNGPIEMDYDPVKRYQLSPPSAHSHPLLGWSLKEGKGGEVMFMWENICAHDDPSCKEEEEGGVLTSVEYVMCEWESEVGKETVDFQVGSLPTIYPTVATRTDAPNDPIPTESNPFDDNSEKKHEHNDVWIIIGVAGSFFFFIILVIIVVAQFCIARNHAERIIRTESMRSSSMYGGSQRGSFGGGSMSSRRGSFASNPGGTSGYLYQKQGSSRGSFNGAPMSRQGSFNGAPMSRQGSFNGNPMQRQGSYNGNLSRQGSFSGYPSQQGSFSGYPPQQGYAVPLQRQGSFSGYPSQQGSFSGYPPQQGYAPPLQRQGSFNGPPLQRRVSFTDDPIQRQGSFSGGSSRQMAPPVNNAARRRISSGAR